MPEDETSEEGSSDSNGEEDGDVSARKLYSRLLVYFANSGALFSERLWMPLFQGNRSNPINEELIPENVMSCKFELISYFPETQ